MITEPAVQPWCMCMQYGPRELALQWQERARPVIRRMLRRGRRVDTNKMDTTMGLMFKMESGATECFSAENFHRSHHLKGCQRRRG